MDSMKNAALDYADRGWQVIPLHSIEQGRCSCRYACKQAGKHPRTKNGLHDASSDPEVIDAWWTRWPDANIGIRTGRASGLYVVDVDAAKSVDLGGGRLIGEGENSIRQLEDRIGERLPDTLTSLTGGGGRHYLYAYPEDAEEFGNRVRVAPSVDVRGENGYIVAPPSVHASGKRYRWVDESEPVVPIPQWFLGLQDKASEDSFVERERVGEGERNDYLFKYAAKLRGEGRDKAELTALVIGHNFMVCDPPLSRAEVMKIVESVWQRYKENPPEPIILWDDDEGSPIPTVEEGHTIAVNIYDLLMNPPEPMKPLIGGGVLDEGDGFILAGPSNIGKSWLAFDMGLSLATGTPWLMEFEVPEAVPVLYLDEESSERADHERIKKVWAGKGIETAWLPFWMTHQQMMKIDEPRGFVTISRLIEQHRPKVVIMDAMVRFHRGDENNTRDMANFFDGIKRLGRAYDTSFVFLHHIRKPTKDDPGDVCDQLRGSSDIKGWPDGVMVVMPGSMGGVVSVNHCKSRNHARIPPFEVGMYISDEEGIAKFGFQGDRIKRPETVEERRDAIMRTVAIISRQTPCTAEIIAGQTHMALKTVQDHLAVLVGEGKIIAYSTTGRGKPNAYLLAPTTPNRWTQGEFET